MEKSRNTTLDLHLFKGKNICIAGLGFIGSRILNFLNRHAKEYQYEVRGFNRDNLNDFYGGEYDYVFNCIGNTGDFRNRIWETIDSNLVQSFKILKFTRINIAYVALSSTRIYGFSSDERTVFDEEKIAFLSKNYLEVDFIYDGTKKLLESALWNSRHQNKFKTIICRLSNIFGDYKPEDLDDSTYLKLLIRNSIEKKEFEVSQNVNSTKDYVYVDDAIDGIIRSALYTTKSDIFNIGSGRSYSLKNWLEFLNSNYIYKGEISPITHSKISIDKAKNGISYFPSFYLDNLNIKKIVNV